MDGRRTRRPSETGEPLSRREWEVACLAVSGLTNRQIAHELRLAEATVKRHLANAYPKLGVGSRAEMLWRLVVDGRVGADGFGPGDAPAGRLSEATRYRCAERGCGREVVVVRDSDSYPAPPVECHGRAMGPVVPRHTRPDA